MALLRASSRPFTCWRCLAQSRQIKDCNLQSAGRRLNPLKANLLLTYSRHASTSTSMGASPESLHNFGPSNFAPKDTPEGTEEDLEAQKSLSIRQRLATWTPAGGDGAGTPRELPSDNGIIGRSPNSWTRSQTSGSEVLATMKPNVEGMADDVVSGRIEIQDFEIGSDLRQPGDLYEFRQYGNRNPVLAVYLGYFGGRNHFYSSAGRWVITVGFGSLFTASNFASASELAPLLAELPRCTSPEEFEAARAENSGPTRACAAHLLEKMDSFMTSAQGVYLSNTENLDTARLQLADPTRVRYLSLFEIADILLPKSLKNDGKFPSYALYAVHTALHRDEIAFRPLSPTSDCHRKDHLFEIFPDSFVQGISRTAYMIRSYYEARSDMTKSSNRRALEKNPMGSFVDKARHIVLSNRKQSREWTPYGILTPSTESSRVSIGNWSNTDMDIINFIQWWASYDLFEPSSRFPAYGATILRSLGLYPDTILDQSLAWTFLQEIALIESWEIPSRYKVRFPGTDIVQGGGLARLEPPGLSESIRPDVALGHRTHLKGQTVFAIDAPETEMVDDAISLERTDNADEFWIHVHAADPSSGITPDSDFAKYMELIPENIYLRGHFQAMMSPMTGGAPAEDTGDLVKQYSLAKDTPALTFSAKVNRTGDLLDYKITPTQLDGIEYLDPADVAKFCEEPKAPALQSHILAVGILPGTPEEKMQYIQRPMKAARDLPAAQQEDILTMYKLACAFREKRLQKGAWPYFFPRPSVKVEFHPVGSIEEPLLKDQDKCVERPPDPYIKVTDESKGQSELVGSTMVLAGEIAARWCADRGIPAPFRGDTKSADNYEDALKYAKDVIYPIIQQGKETSMEQKEQLFTITGATQISATPGPYFIMGLDMYLKATSPLRRFADLLTHWQIHGALAHERQLGRKIDAKTDDLDALLPFSLSVMEGKISLLHMREKMARRISRGDRDWILMALVRAWQFEKTAPAKFRFTVESRWKPGLLGSINYFGLKAAMDTAGIDGKALLRDIKVGDQFDVELVNVNVHSGEIVVKALEFYPIAEPVTGEQLEAKARLETAE